MLMLVALVFIIAIIASSFRLTGLLLLLLVFARNLDGTKTAVIRAVSRNKAVSALRTNVHHLWTFLAVALLRCIHPRLCRPLLPHVLVDLIVGEPASPWEGTR